MLSCVMNSPRPVAVNIEIMRTCVRMRKAIVSQADILCRLGLVEVTSQRTAAELGLQMAGVSKTLKVVFEALRQLSEPSEPPKESVGFKLR